MSIYAVAPLDVHDIKTVSLASRRSTVSTTVFARRVDATSAGILDSLPDILGARELKRLSARIQAARSLGKPVLFGIGAHVLKVGLAPILIQLAEEGFVDGVAMNGAGIIHDFEIAWCGATSEDVDSALPGGQFGVTRETGEVLNRAVSDAARDDIGIGESVGRAIAEMTTPTVGHSLLAACYRLKIPVTVHVAIGTDVLHIHPSADGAAIGRGSLRDFRLFSALVSRLDGGGVYINIGSAVILPEVFLKAVTIVRNLGMPLSGFTTANMDFAQHYRPLTNVVRRPVTSSEDGIALTGHHEILLPLLAAALLSGTRAKNSVQDDESRQ